MVGAKTAEILSLVGGKEPALVKRALDALNMNNEPGRGVSRTLTFNDALVVVTYIQLCQSINYKVAKKIALELRQGLKENNLPEEPCALIGSSDLICWVAGKAATEKYLEHCRELDPVVSMYRIPFNDVRGLFDPVTV